MLHGVDVRRRRGRGRDAARPQRRRQDDDAEVDHGHRAAARGLDRVRRAARSSRSPPTGSRSAASRIVPEERGIFASLDVEENLLLPPIVRDGGLSVAQIFELFPNLKERLKSQGTKLSGGEQQMLAIGRILRTGARLLLLDEPTEGLAPVIVQQIGRTIAQAQGAGLHDPAGRAEFPFRGDGRGPALRDGPRPRRRHDSQCRARREHGQAARLPRRLDPTLPRIHNPRAACDRTGAPLVINEGGSMKVFKRTSRRPRRRRRAVGRRRAGADFGQRRQDRRAVRHVEPVHRPRRRGLRRRGADGGRGFRHREARHQGRDRLGRPPEQARRRLGHRAPVVRHRQGRRDRRRAELRRRARRQPDHEGQGQGVPRVRPGVVRPDRQGVLAEHGALDLRHVDARQRHRQRDRQVGRRHAGSSSPPTTRSATRSSATPRPSC